MAPSAPASAVRVHSRTSWTDPGASERVGVDRDRRQGPGATAVLSAPARASQNRDEPQGEPLGGTQDSEKPLDPKPRVVTDDFCLKGRNARSQEGGGGGEEIGRLHSMEIGNDGPLHREEVDR